MYLNNNTGGHAQVRNVTTLLTGLFVTTLMAVILHVGAPGAEAAGFYNYTDKEVRFRYCPGSICLIWDEKEYRLGPGEHMSTNGVGGSLRHVSYGDTIRRRDHDTMACMVEDFGYVKFEQEGQRFRADVYTANHAKRACHVVENLEYR